MRKAVTAFAVAAAIIISLGYIFELKNVTVSGSVHTDAGTVSDLVCTDWTLGNTLLVRLFNRNRKIKGEGFIRSVNATIVKNHWVQIDVTEKRLVGCVCQNEKYWYFDSSGTVQAESQALTAGDKIPYAEGLALETEVVYGEKLPVSSSSPIMILTTLKSSLDAGLMQPDKAVFADDGTVSLVYGEVTILLGDGTDLSLRLEKLSEFIDILTDGTYRGTLHLESYDGTQKGIIFDRS